MEQGAAAMASDDRPKLAVGTIVGHANPELADWEGIITPNRRGDWHRRRWEDLPEVWVKWTAGTDGNGGPMADGKPGWFPIDALTVKGECPDCKRPAHYVLRADAQWNRSEGWAHDVKRHALTCWAGKATFEASHPELASD